ncbi:alpha/beta fold hydrolase [Patulibacter minatonensis]|uniref:alpha/beta fold hydrolase n=1 Tax=Patulibacter minatonensis TaxID=298163 RepID=UPI00047A955D|nr:alpha/beta fold hydrolase [Patulibacter minatonensis]
MTERLVDVGDGIVLCVDELGDPDHPTLLLMQGMGLGLVWWRDDFCAALVDRGLRVVRYDHRDVGRSTPCRGAVPGVAAIITRRSRPVYTLEDLADDAGRLVPLVAGDGTAHVAGVSLGSFVAQQTAIRHPDRVRSLTSIMGRPGDGRTGKVAWRMRPEFLRSGPRDPEGAAEHLVGTFGRIGSTGRTAEDDEDVRIAFRRSAQRDQGDGAGGGRQFAAVLAETDRTPGLRDLAIPALVVHGTRDRVVKPSGGRATAAAIPGAELLEIEGMGHDLPRRVWEPVVDGIARTVARA